MTPKERSKHGIVPKGKYHLKVPKDPLKNLRFRKAILKAAASDLRLQKGLIEMCRRDILFFINTFVIQINPELMEKGPFIAWPYQETAILGGEIDLGGIKRYQHGILQSVHDRQDVRWPKSREGGASYCVLITILWLCLFHDNIIAGAISRDADSVDMIGNPNSLFEKIRIMIKHLPEWLCGGKIYDKKLNFQFPNGNTIIGGANVSSAQVGGRLTILLVDEFGQFERNGEDIFDFTRDVCHCRVFVFTHKDQSGMAYKLCFDAKFLNTTREIITHWSQHPLKNKGLYRFNDQTNKVDVLDKTFDFTTLPEFDFDTTGKPIGGPCPGIRSPWYDFECARRNDRDIHMNLDIDPRGSSEYFFDSYRINILKADTSPPLWTGELEHDRRGNPLKLVPSGDGKLKLWVRPKVDIESIENWNRVFPKMQCGAGVDVAAGNLATPSCLSIGCADSGEKFLEYMNADIFASDFATLVCAICRMFVNRHNQHPLLVWEIQGSYAFERQMVDILRYTPYYINRDETVLGKPMNAKGRAGWSVNPKNIMTLMEDYRDALYQGHVVNPSEFALDETLKFVYSGAIVEYRASAKKIDKSSGARVHHGDIVRADALMYKMIKDMSGVPVVIETKKIPDMRTLAGREWLYEQKLIESQAEVWQ